MKMAFFVRQVKKMLQPNIVEENKKHPKFQIKLNKIN